VIEHQELLKINDNKIDHPSPDGSKDLADGDSLLVEGLTVLEIDDGSLGTGKVNDPKLIALAEKYLIARSGLKKKGIKETDKQYIKSIAEKMNLTEAQAKKVKE